MSPQRSFGRRADAKPFAQAQSRPTARIEPVVSVPAPTPQLIAPVAVVSDPFAPSLDDELKAWKAERRRSVGLSNFPLRLLYLVASASCGIASYALPASVADWMNWVLYALAVGCIVVWFAGGKKA